MEISENNDWMTGGVQGGEAAVGAGAGRVGREGGRAGGFLLARVVRAEHGGGDGELREAAGGGGHQGKQVQVKLQLGGVECGRLWGTTRHQVHHLNQ